MTQSNLQSWRTRADQVLPAGGFGNFDPGVVLKRGLGSHVWDEDGKEYIDYLIGSGPMLVGHGHPEVIEAVQEQLANGMTFFTTNALGIELAEVICDAIPCADQLRYVSTGSEADMYAMRLARAHTGRDLILKFEGGYHGMSGEALMSLAPQHLANFPEPVPDSAGIPQATRDGVIVAPFNDTAFARQIIAEYADRLAGVIVEPLQRLIPPVPGFLEALREETTKHGVVLIFDEVVTGFRLAWGGGQEAYGVTPDLCTLGKVIGGGFPLAAIAGTADIMAHFDLGKVGPKGFTFQIGTLSGNPIAAAAGLKTLEILKRDGAYDSLRAAGQRLMNTLETTAAKEGLTATIVGDPVLFDIVFAAGPVVDYRDTLRTDADIQNRFNASLRADGILKPPMKFYPSLTLSEADIEATEHAIARAMKASMNTSNGC
ncbi:aminotransferase class III-fold pyridoxal phosphate-dependent enzyme [Ruegeria sp.]|uniref:aspartate aminotransferase family protein n=1 Tax=Ruegeria sp. TaxID=1879320 RepID=UPI00230FCCA8|nr:aminotransferase class III-fold pyridoxal phosphate-dependent enzyme [Ruegeria sp.]MDA7964417.1 aminotransferase class III-fold pyridoxal phosphate-dependent enzyme [Ruegeria sp.]